MKCTEGPGVVGCQEKASLEHFALDRRAFDHLRLDKCAVNNHFDNKHLSMVLKPQAGELHK